MSEYDIITAEEIFLNNNCDCCEHGYDFETDEYKCELINAIFNDDKLRDDYRQRIGMNKQEHFPDRCDEWEEEKINTGGFYKEPAQQRCKKTIDMFKVRE